MKKKLILAVIAIAILISAVIIVLPFKMLDIITVYEPFTFARVFNDTELRNSYGINEKSEPEDYGFTSEEINITSLYDSLHLSGWYIKNNPLLNKSIVFVHGRTSNRLKTMKFLELVKRTGLDTMYNVLLPDLRNSGNSEEGNTLMGYHFAEDLLAFLLHLKETEEQDTVILYAFSMGAMAVMTSLNREDLKKKYTVHNITVEKFIFDSPLVNVRKTLSGNAEKMFIPSFIFDETFELVNKETDGFADKMKMSVLIEEIDQPVLIFQSKDDQTTTYDILKEEIQQIDKENLKIVLYQGIDHVKIFQTDSLKDSYMQTVNDFIRK